MRKSYIALSIFEEGRKYPNVEVAQIEYSDATSKKNQISLMVKAVMDDYTKIDKFDSISWNHFTIVSKESTKFTVRVSSISYIYNEQDIMDSIGR